ncbi:MAG: TIM44-like domain-containing protein [Pseudomonadota bacterium]|nr:TIM44-like domain-containing protein [Pseudomonadota bacterium]
MQNKAQSAVLALLLTSFLAVPIAEAKRAGGGKSYGMKRQSSSQSYNNSSQNSYQQNNTANQQTQRRGSNVGGMVAAGVGGAALGAVAANAMADDRQSNPTQQEEEKSGFSWIWLILIAGVAFFLFRKFIAKKQHFAGGTPNPYAPNNHGNGQARTQSAPTQSPFQKQNTPSGNTNIFGQPLNGGTNTQTAPSAQFGATMNSGNALPDGTEPASFLRFARQRFNHIQAMNSGSNIDEIRKYFTTDMYQQMHQEIANNHDVAEFSNLTANVVEQATENGQYVVSVRFTGTVSEDLNSLPQPFTEIWHFVKTENSQEDWLVAGIQQV